MDLFCPWESPQYLFFSSNVPELFYYSHGVAVLFALVFGFFVFYSAKKNLEAKLLFYLTIIFSIWVLLDLYIWAQNDPSHVLFFWSLIGLFEVFIYVLSVYFVSVFLGKKDVSFSKKVTFFSALLPVIITLPTVFNLVGIYIGICDASEGFITKYYTYIVQIICLIYIIMFGIRKYRSEVDVKNKRQVYLTTLGVTFFLIAFSSGNIIGSFFGLWEFSQIGLFAMPVLVGLLAYLVTKYKSFNIKLIATQSLVVGLDIIIASQFFFIEDRTSIILNSIAFISIVFLGNNLIRTVRHEVEQKEKLQVLSNEITDANTKLQSLDKLKTEFLSLASHQLRSPLTAIKGYSSMLLEGSFGSMTLQQKEAVDRVFQSVQHLTKVVNDLLNVSKIEQGGMVYSKANYDFGKSAKNVTEELSLNAKNKNLTLTYEDDGTSSYNIFGDEEKIRQVLINLIDNSIKYTPEGSIIVRVSKAGNKVLFSVNDTGMGMTEETRQTLFKKFARGEGGKINTSGSGLGLYLAKEIAEAHHGRVWVESPGPEKGSTFFVELELAK